MKYFEDMGKAKAYAKKNAPNETNLRGCRIKFGIVPIETPVGPIEVCVGLSGTSGSGSRRPTSQVSFKDSSGFPLSQKRLQDLIDRKVKA